MARLGPSPTPSSTSDDDGAAFGQEASARIDQAAARRQRRAASGRASSFPWPLSDTQQALRAAAREFAALEISPIAEESDRTRSMDSTVLDCFHRAGMTTRFLEARAGDDFVATACLITEEIAYACASYASYLMLPVFFNRVVAAALSPPARARFVAECRAAPVVTSFAASEAVAGSDMLALAVRAQPTPDGYRLEGRKEYSSNLRHARYVIVVARTRPDDQRATDALSWFLVPTESAGLIIGDRWETLGLRAMDLSPLDLREVSVPDSCRLGEEGHGLALLGENLAQSRTGIASLGVGIARRARDLVIEHARRRRLFGQKLAHMQDYRFRIAEMERDIAAGRALTWLAASRIDRGEEATKEASIAKSFVGEMVMQVTTAASAMLGSVGYTGQSPVEKLLRDARHVGIVEGTDPIHKEIIFAHLLRHGAY